MARFSDKSNVAHTCPFINTVIDFIKKNTKEEVCTTEIIEILEEIRSANGELRDWGNETYNEKESIEREIDKANSEIDRLIYKINELEGEINELKNELKQL